MAILSWFNILYTYCDSGSRDWGGLWFTLNLIIWPFTWLFPSVTSFLSNASPFAHYLPELVFSTDEHLHLLDTVFTAYVSFTFDIDTDSYCLVTPCQTLLSCSWIISILARFYFKRYSYYNLIQRILLLLLFLIFTSLFLWLYTAYGCSKVQLCEID